jgi:ArsR family transcriptional regulator, arsenate/arsenite/antimonite-responsive transcriptional repressor
MTDNETIAAFAALGSDIRYALWKALLPYGHEGMPAGNLAAQMTTNPSRLSFHLRTLVEANVLYRRRVRRNLVYAVNQAMVVQLATLLASSGRERLAAIVPIPAIAD